MGPLRIILVLIAVSVLGFAVWYVMRPDPRAGEPAVEAQMATAPAPAADEEPLPEPMPLGEWGATIGEAFEATPWVSGGNTGPVLYVISFRTCPACLAFKDAELEGLMDAGVDIRWIIYARRDREDRQRSSAAERAVQAELWLGRDWHLFEEWFAIEPGTYYETAELPPLADDDPDRDAAVEEARAFVDRMSDLFGEAGVDLFIPALLWQEDGEWMAYVGYEDSTFGPVREALLRTQ